MKLRARRKVLSRLRANHTAKKAERVSAERMRPARPAPRVEVFR